jgi:scyllo-inositol 2-dehydrogenase (NADP+)
VSPRIKVAISGFGLSGRIFHYQLIAANSLFEVVAVQTTQKDAHLSLPDSVKICSTYDELLAQHSDVVVICVPNELHFDYALKAIQSGRDVVLEKPFVVTSSDGKKLIEVAQRNGRVLSVFHNRRWDADFLTIKGLIEKGTLGEINHFEAHFDRFKPVVDQRWKERPEQLGGGILYDLGSHLIDQAMQLFGRPSRVFADIQCQRQNAMQDDYFHMILDMGKTRAILHAGAIVAQPGPRYIVHGSKGSFLKSGIDPQEHQLKSGLSPNADSFGVESDELAGELFLVGDSMATKSRIKSQKGSYRTYYEELATAIKSCSLPPVAAESALDVVRVIECARESARAGKWISLS